MKDFLAGVTVASLGITLYIGSILLTLLLFVFLLRKEQKKVGQVNTKADYEWMYWLVTNGYLSPKDARSVREFTESVSESREDRDR
jgi:hypothetical protein